MTAEQWTLVERLYHEAAAIAVTDRAAWLARACDGDEIVRRDVLSLLAQNTSGVRRARAADKKMAGPLARNPPCISAGPTRPAPRCWSA